MSNITRRVSFALAIGSLFGWMSFAEASPTFSVVEDFPASTGGPHGLNTDAAGYLYGIGGCYGTSYPDYAVFKLSPPPAGGHVWTESVIYAFIGGADQTSPVGLAFDSSGNLFGTTAGGNLPNYGSIFELIRPSSGDLWEFQLIHHFTGDADGGAPSGAPYIDAKGNLYGTTYWGGIKAGSNGAGVLYEFSPPASAGSAWSENIIHAFTAGHDGGYPSGNLIADKAGNLYGTASYGGSSKDLAGIAFEFIRPSSGHSIWSEKILCDFDDDGHGGTPSVGLVMDSAGNLYGTAHDVFKLSPPANGHTVWSLSWSGRNSGEPLVTVGGDVYAEFAGDLAGDGNAFRLNPPGFDGHKVWTKTDLHNFTGGRDGGGPSGGLVVLPSSTIYGVTSYGGRLKGGTLFQISP